jgi:hypothetical protein
MYHHWHCDLPTAMAPTRQLDFLDASLLLVGLWLSLKVIRILLRGSKNTQLKGPPSESWIFGFSHFINTEDPSVAYEQWAEQYGAVFRIPIAIYLSITSRLAIGQTKMIICDPKAIQHIYSKTTFGYLNSRLRKNELNSIVHTFIQICRMKAKLDDRWERVSCWPKAISTRGEYPSTDSLHLLC